MPNTVDSLLEITKRNLKSYGEEVVEQRAVPDYRDGLKPVHRFILWACYGLGLKSTGPFKKAARTVGDVIGRYSPHGDQATYQAMVGMAGVRSEDNKTWVTRNTPVPLIEGYGNWGDNLDNAAAMRYCFSGDTRVMTEDGLLRIDSLAPSDSKYKAGRSHSYTRRVASLDLARNASHWVNSGKRTLYELTTERGFKVRATSNEPFLTLDSFDYSWTELSRLRVGDFVSLKRGSDITPKSGAALPSYVKQVSAPNAIAYCGSEFPKTMSTDLAFILGVLVAEGHARFGVGFNNTNRPYYDKFIACWARVFPTIEFSERLRSPVSFGKKLFKSFSVHGTDLKKYFETLGMRWGSYNQVIPEVMFRASREEMSAFLSGLFEGDGSIAGTFIDYHSKSNQLYRDVQNVLLNYYGCVATIGNAKLYITGNANIGCLLPHLTFEASNKKRAAKKMLHRCAAGSGNTLSDRMPEKFMRYVADFARSVKTTKRRFISEAGEYVPFSGTGNVLGIFERFPKISHRAVRRIDARLEAFAEFFPRAAKRLEKIAERDYFYDRIVSIEKVGKDWTYDLTVPKTNAFVANGFVVHNTEGRLSEFSDKYLLDPVYLAVSDYVPNFSQDEKVPLVLPAKLPVLLLNGSVSIAFGISAETPSFALPGVLSLVKSRLSGVELTPAMCAKALTFSPAYGGECVSSKATVLQFFKDGAGSLDFLPSYTVDEKTRSLTLTSACPGLTSPASWKTLTDKLTSLPCVKSVSDSTDKSGFKFQVVSERNVEFQTFVDTVLKLAQRKQSYSIGVTIREPSGVSFRRMNVPTLITEWCDWRISLELRVIQHLLSLENAKLARSTLLLLAVDHLKVILDALRIDDSAAYIAQHLKISIEEANTILDLKVRQLKSLERGKLKAQISECKASIKILTADSKDPTKRILKELAHISVRH